MATFRIGQRVKTTVDAPAAWDGAFSAPAGTTGVIAGLPSPGRYSSYGVVLDGDDSHLPASYSEDELTTA